MLTNTVIILNAPPAAGKNVMAEALCEATGASHCEMKSHLYQCTATLFNVPVDTLKGLLDDRETKEVPNTLFAVSGSQYKKVIAITGDEDQDPWYKGDVALTPRQALVYVSECVIKPSFGNDYFGKIAADNIDMELGAVFSDGGFDSEITPIVQKHGRKNVFIVQFTGQGSTDFQGDSRDWLTIPSGVASIKTTNDGTIEEIRDYILKWIDYEREVQVSTFGG